MLFVENNAQMQKLFLSTRPKTGFIFLLLQRLSKDQPLLRMKIYVFCIPYEKYRGPGRRPMPGQYEENLLYHCLKPFRYAVKQKKRYYLGIFPKHRTHPPLLGTPYPKKYEICIMKYEI